MFSTIQWFCLEHLGEDSSAECQQILRIHIRFLWTRFGHRNKDTSKVKVNFVGLSWMCINYRRTFIQTSKHPNFLNQCKWFEITRCSYKTNQNTQEMIFGLQALGGHVCLRDCESVSFKKCLSCYTCSKHPKLSKSSWDGKICAFDYFENLCRNMYAHSFCLGYKDNALWLSDAV